MPIAALRFRRMQASKHGGFGMIQIWTAELGFPPSQFPFLAFAPHGRPPPDGWPMRMRQPWWLVDGIAVYRELKRRTGTPRPFNYSNKLLSCGHTWFVGCY